MPRGAVSIVLASIYLVGTLILIALAARHFFQHRTLRARQVALYTALATPAIAAAALMAYLAADGLAAVSVPLGTAIVLLGSFLVVSGSVLVVTMLLAVTWALGHVVDTPYLPLEWMVATHGVANAVGFALCGVLAMRREARDAAG